MNRVIYGVILMIFVAGAASCAYNEKTELLLSGNEIDLLVGTPTGIVEPLDNRRTRVDESISHDFSNLLEEDFAAAGNLSDLSWADAEDMPIDPSQAEAQLIDLLAETGELENFDFNENCENEEANSTDYVETEFKL